MAPALQEPHQPTVSTTMSSQSRLPSILKTNSNSQGFNRPPGTFRFGQTTKIAVGKDCTQLEIMTMAPPSEEQFMRSTFLKALCLRYKTTK